MSPPPHPPPPSPPPPPSRWSTVDAEGKPPPHPPPPHVGGSPGRANQRFPSSNSVYIVGPNIALHAVTSNWGCFPGGKRAAAVQFLSTQLFFSLLMCAMFCVIIMRATGREAYSFATDGYGIFNVRTNLARAVHTKVG